MSKYIVWICYGVEGWNPSDEFVTLDECFQYIAESTYSNQYRITKLVNVEFKEVDND